MVILKSMGCQPETIYKIHKPITTIGSDERADIQISPQAPKILGHIQRVGDRYTIIISNKLFPVLVNGERIYNRDLMINDQIICGKNIWLCDSSNTTNNLLLEKKADEEEVQTLERLLHFSLKLSSKNDISTLLEALMDEIIAIAKAEQGFLVLLENDQPSIAVTRATSKRKIFPDEHDLSDSILHKVLATKKPLLVNDALNHSEFSLSHSVINLRLSSVMCVPLLNQGELIGALYVGNNSLTGAFAEKSLAVMTIFASQAALLVKQALHISALTREAKNLRENLERVRFGGLIGASSIMQECFVQIEKIAKSDANVVIMGEPGVGKEIVAREIHSRSTKASMPFISLSCSGTPEQLLMQELIHNRQRISKLNRARGGTLYIEDIDQMPAHIQTNFSEELVRLEQENLQVRIICSTTKDVVHLKQLGLVREDLFYQLYVMHVTVPSLRDRGNDILVLANFFLKKHAELYGKNISRFSVEAQNLLLNFDWPGNVRQLENRIKSAVALASEQRGQIEVADVDIDATYAKGILSLNDAVERFKTRYIQESLERNAGNKTKAAKELGIDPRTMFRLLAEKTSNDVA